MIKVSNRRKTIRDPRSFRRGAGRNAMRIDSGFGELVIRKKGEVTKLIWDLLNSKAITSILDTSERRESLFFRVKIGEKIIELKFFIWTGATEKDPDYSNSQFAKFILRTHESIEDLGFKVLNYLEGIERGLTTEYLGMVVLKELMAEPLQERKFKYFRKATPNEDRYEGKDFIIIVISDGREIEVSIQFKSSEEELMNHKERFPSVPGLFREFTGNRRGEMDIMREKVVRIIKEYIGGKIIFI